MKKFIVLSALAAAASTAFVACSSDDDLAQQPKAPETTVEEGTPLVIKVVDATRGTDWTENTLPSISVYGIEHEGTTRGFGTNDGSSSIGVFFKNDGSGNFASGTLSTANPPVFTAGNVSWPNLNKKWDIYALSNKDDVSTFDFAQSGGADLEDFARATGRNFTYTVPTTYADQKDLLVAAAMEQSEGADVYLPFYHALARIEKIKVNFKKLSDKSKLESNSGNYFLIKSITLKNVVTTGTFTFPDDTWDASATSTWWTPSVTTGDYTIELTDFQRENGLIKVFDEYDGTATDGSENNAYKYANTTRVTGEPNFFAPGEGRHELPIAADDEGLYLLPQNLSTTVNENGTDYTLTGPYVEIVGFVINDAITWTDVQDAIDINDEDGAGEAVTAGFSFAASDGGTTDVSKANNYNITQAMNTAIGKYACPITTTLLPNKRYVLNIDLSNTLSKATKGKFLFDGAEVTTGNP